MRQVSGSAVTGLCRLALRGARCPAARGFSLLSQLILSIGRVRDGHGQRRGTPWARPDPTAAWQRRRGTEEQAGHGAPLSMLLPPRAGLQGKRWLRACLVPGDTRRCQGTRPHAQATGCEKEGRRAGRAWQQILPCGWDAQDGSGSPSTPPSQHRPPRTASAPHGNTAGKCTSPVLPALPGGSRLFAHIALHQTLPLAQHPEVPAEEAGPTPGPPRLSWPGQCSHSPASAAVGYGSPLRAAGALEKHCPVTPRQLGEQHHGAATPLQSQSRWHLWVRRCRAGSWLPGKRVRSHCCHAGHGTSRQRAWKRSGTGTSSDHPAGHRQLSCGQRHSRSLQEEQARQGGTREALEGRAALGQHTASTVLAPGPRAEARAATGLWHNTAEWDRDRHSKPSRRRHSTRGSKVGAKTIPQPHAGHSSLGRGQGGQRDRSGQSSRVTYLSEQGHGAAAPQWCARAGGTTTPSGFDPRGTASPVPAPKGCVPQKGLDAGAAALPHN